MHFEQMGVSLYIPGQEKELTKLSATSLAPANITKWRLVEWIEASGIDDYTKSELLKQLQKYPANTMKHFYSNINKHIDRIHQNRPKK